MSNAATHIDEQWRLRRQVLAKLLFEIHDVGPALFALALSAHPLHGILELCRVNHESFERGEIGVVARLERTLPELGWILVLGIGQVLGQLRIDGHHAREARHELENSKAVRKSLHLCFIPALSPGIASVSVMFEAAYLSSPISLTMFTPARYRRSRSDRMY